jgi:hypothetical protein
MTRFHLRRRGRAAFLGLLGPFLLWLGRRHLPFTKRRVHEAHVVAALARLQPGDVILTRERGAPTNLIIPGRYTHATIWSPKDGRAEVVEAVGEGVRVTGIYDLLMAHDGFAIMRARESTKEQRCAAAEIARTFVGRPYDVRLEMEDDYGKRDGEREFYCGELPCVAHRKANPRFTFRGGQRLGVWTAEPMDYFWQRDKFMLVLECDPPAGDTQADVPPSQVPA